MKRILLMGLAAFCAASTAAGEVTARTEHPNPAEAAPKLKNIIVVYKTHFDIGYSALASQVIHLYRTSMMDQTLKVIDQYKALPKHQQFVWTIPGWPMEQMLWPGQDPARKQQIEAAVRAGNLAVHALPFSVQNETVELEDLARGLHFSADIARRYGLPLPRGAKTTDVPDQTWVLPTVLRHAGIDFLHIGVNDATMPATAPVLFWWEGPDGSRLLTMLSDKYGSPPNPPAHWPHSAWLYVHMTYDNMGPPPPETLQRDLDYFQQRYPGATVKIGQLSDFFDALTPDDLSNVPVVRADMPDCWTYGFPSSPAGCQAVAQGRPLLSATEFLAALNAAWGVRTANPRRAVAEAYEKSLLWSEHTWGLATQGHISYQYIKDGDITRAVPQPVEGVAAMQASWEEKLGYALDIGKILAKPCAEQLRALAANVHIEGGRILVFNPLAWRRDDIVHATGHWTAGTAVQSDDGVMTPCEIAGTNLSFVARGVPSLGYRAYRVVTGATPSGHAQGCTADAAKHTIESPAFRVAFDPARGRVVSLFDKRARRELVDDSAPRGLGYFYQRFSKQDAQDYAQAIVSPPYRQNAVFRDIFCKTGIPAGQPHLDFTPSNMTFTAAVTPLGVAATMSGTLSAAVPQRVRLTFTLYRDLPCVDISVDLDNQGRVDGWPEACSFSLPLKVEHPQFRVGRVGSIVNPVTDFMENSSRHYYWSNPGVAVFNERGGVGVTAVDSPLVSLGEPGIMKFDGAYVPTKSRVYFNIHNSVYHTNFTDWWSGLMHSLFRLWSFNHYDNASALLEPGLNAKRPLLAAFADGPAGKLPTTQTGLSVSRSGVLVTAFGDNPDGQGTLLRVWEQSGTSGELTVSLPAGAEFTSATPVNLRGEQTGAPISILAGALKFDLHAYAPASFLLR